MKLLTVAFIVINIQLPNIILCGVLREQKVEQTGSYLCCYFAVVSVCRTWAGLTVDSRDPELSSLALLPDSCT